MKEVEQIIKEENSNEFINNFESFKLHTKTRQIFLDLARFFEKRDLDYLAEIKFLKKYL